MNTNRCGLLLKGMAFLLLFSLVGCARSCDRGKRREHARERSLESRRSSFLLEAKEKIVSASKRLEGPSVSKAAANVNAEDGISLYKKNKNAVFFIITSNGYSAAQGSGFFVSTDGIGISNYHVFRGSIVGAEEITLIDGSTYSVAKVYDKSEELDYIIFKVAVDKKVPYLKIASSDPQVGEYVFAIGNPKGVDHVFTDGKVSKVESPYILSQTPITHGSSGGPLMNAYGEVVGITSGNMQEKHEAMFNYAISIQALKLGRFIRE